MTMLRYLRETVNGSYLEISKASFLYGMGRIFIQFIHHDILSYFPFHLEAENS